MFAARNSFVVGSGAKPNAPTIGTATATGTTTATVSYTAPAFDGGSPITSYTATSSPGGITGTISQAGSGTITVSGLSSGTNYTFTVTATNALGTSSASSASNSILTTPVIGQSFQGGYYGGAISTSANGVATHYLIVAGKSAGESSDTYGINGFADPTSFIDGPTNSSTLLASGLRRAAIFCEGLSIGGYSDWYLPAYSELVTIYYYLKPSTTSNDTNGGYTDYAVSPQPISTYNLSGTPAQTSVSNFQSGGADYFESNTYWSSTQQNANAAYTVSFTNGQGNASSKSATLFIRAIRRVAV
jgi:hypothetical protein